MQVIILAAGYATRLYPLTKDRPKPLLPVAGKAILDYIIEKVEAVPDVEKIHVVTNARFYSHFTKWLEQRPGSDNIEIINDETDSDENKLGAIGDIDFVIRNKGIEKDLMVIGGDNIFEFDLIDYDRMFRERGPVVGLYQTETLEEIKKYNCIVLDDSGRITSFEEKPKNPTTKLFAIALYYYDEAAITLMRRYLDEGGNPDAPGYYVQWLYRQMPVYGFAFDGKWYDIGNLDVYDQAQAYFKERN